MLNERLDGFRSRRCPVDNAPCEGQGTIADCDICQTLTDEPPAAFPYKKGEATKEDEMNDKRELPDRDTRWKRCVMKLSNLRNVLKNHDNPYAGSGPEYEETSRISPMLTKCDKAMELGYLEGVEEALEIDPREEWR